MATTAKARGVNGRKVKPAALETLEPVTNDGAFSIEKLVPYHARVIIEGTAPILFHAWSCDSIAEKAAASKGSAAKKEDDINTYVYRNEDGHISIPGEYLRQASINAARYEQDPRSPRKSAMDLYKAGVVATTELCSLGTKEWDYLDRRRVTIQRQGVNRSRPAMRVGWQCEVQLMVLTPEYLPTQRLHANLVQAGRLVGIGDYRPTYGRFQVVSFTTGLVQ